MPVLYTNYQTGPGNITGTQSTDETHMTLGGSNNVYIGPTNASATSTTTSIVTTPTPLYTLNEDGSTTNNHTGQTIIIPDTHNNPVDVLIQQNSTSGNVSSQIVPVPTTQSGPILSIFSDGSSGESFGVASESSVKKIGTKSYKKDINALFIIGIIIGIGYFFTSGE